MLREEVTVSTEFLGFRTITVGRLLAYSNLEETARRQRLEPLARARRRQTELGGDVTRGPPPIRPAQHHDELDVIDRLDAAVKKRPQLRRE